MKVTKRCPLCELGLEFESNGVRMAFTAHDGVMCSQTMRSEILTLRRVLKDTQEWAAEREGSLHRHVGELRQELQRLREEKP